MHADPPLSRPREHSGWAERIAVAVLAVCGLLISLYLASYQLGITPAPWDPIFGSASSERVLTSPLSRALPIPDAALGAAAYLVELILALVGGRARWREHPWLVALYGLVVAGLGVVSLILVAAQIFWFHSFCTLCLTSATISFVNAWLAHGEVMASLDVLRHGRPGEPPAHAPLNQAPPSKAPTTTRREAA